MKIFKPNKDKLLSKDKIKVGQQLIIPGKCSRTMKLLR